MFKLDCRGHSISKDNLEMEYSSGIRSECLQAFSHWHPSSFVQIFYPSSNVSLHPPLFIPCWLRFLAPSLRMWVCTLSPMLILLTEILGPLSQDVSLHPFTLVDSCWLRFFAPSLRLWVCTLPPLLISSDSGSWLHLQYVSLHLSSIVDFGWLRFLAPSLRMWVCTLPP